MVNGVPRVASWWWLAWLLVGACRIGGAVEPVPLVGSAPTVVVVWPVLEAAGATAAGATAAGAAAADDLLHGLDVVLRLRGYRVVPPRVAEQMLLDAGIAVPTFAAVDLAAVGKVLLADAVLRLVVREFAAAAEEPLQQARWDVEWNLVSTRGLGVQWSFAHHGSWRARDRDQQDPLRRLDAEPDIVPVGGNRTPGFRSRADLAHWLHRHALEHLPRAGS